MTFRVAYKSYSKNHVQNFDRKKITLTRCGETYNVYDAIQAAREDTEIYPTLEKYHCIDKLVVSAQGTYADISNALDLRGLHDQEIELKNIFDRLPLEVRRDFNHDFFEFKEKGLEYFEKKAQEEIVKAQPVEPEVTNDGGNVNVEK